MDKTLIIKSILGKFEKFIFGINNRGNELLVLNFHSTTTKYIDQFSRQIEYLNEHFIFVNPSFLDEYYYSNKFWEKEKRPILLTFDDGIKSNLAAIEVLNKYQIKALFFIIPGFIDSLEPEKYFRENIRPNYNEYFDQEQIDRIPMSWSDLKTICANGHQVGCHSFTHTLNAEMSISQSEFEIEDSRRRIIENLKVLNVQNFCGPYNSLFSVGEIQMDIIKKKYMFFHSTIPGSNNKGNPFFIHRVNIECFWPIDAMVFAIGRFDVFRFAKQNEKFELLVNKA